MMLYERAYVLTVGNYKTGSGIQLKSDGFDEEQQSFVRGVNIAFSFAKDSDNSRTTNSAEISVFNLSRDQRKLIDGDFIEISLSVGYKDTGAQLMVQGNVVEVSHNKSGPDWITTFKVGEAYAALNHRRVKALVSAGKTIENCIDVVREAMGGDITKGIYRGDGLKKPVVSGMSLHGTPREQLIRLCKANDLEWNITGNVLNITGKNEPSSKSTVNATVLNEETGLINVPYYTSAEGKKLPKDKTRKRGVKFEALLNTALVPGSIVKLEDPDISGFFRVNTSHFSGSYRGDTWQVECFCSEIDAEELV